MPRLGRRWYDAERIVSHGAELPPRIACADQAMPEMRVPRRLDIARINYSGVAVLMLLAGLVAAAALDPPSKNRVPKISDEDRRLTAYHESGHALLAAHLPAGGDILQVSIVSRWGVLGSMTRASVDSDLGDDAGRARKEAELVIALGGLIAEGIARGDGAMTEAMTSDIKAAEKVAFDLLGRPTAGLAFAEVEAGVRQLMNDAERRARAILNSHEAELHRLAAALLEHGTLEAVDVADVFKGRTVTVSERN